MSSCGLQSQEEKRDMNRDSADEAQDTAQSDQSTAEGTEGTDNGHQTDNSTTNGTASSKTVTSSNFTPTDGQSSLPSASNQVSPGSAAGIGIGCAVLGAIIAGLIFVFIFRRRHRRQMYSTHNHLPPVAAAHVGNEKREFAATSGAVSNVDRLLSMPAEDGALNGALSRIRDNIKNHAQNYYQAGESSHTSVDSQDFGDLPHATSMSASSIQSLLSNPVTRADTIRLIIAHSVLSKCFGRSDPAKSLLPQEVAAFAQFQASHDTANSDQCALFSKWRTISAVLLHEKYDNQNRTSDDRSTYIARTVADIDSILRPFVNPDVDAGARHRHLEGIVWRAAQFGFLVFSQPGLFELDFTAGRPDELVVFPSMLQTVSDEAKAQVPHRILSAKETVIVRN